MERTEQIITEKAIVNNLMEFVGKKKTIEDVKEILRLIEELKAINPEVNKEKIKRMARPVRGIEKALKKAEKKRDKKLKRTGALSGTTN